MTHLSKITVMGAFAISTALTALPAVSETLVFVSWMKDEPGYGDWWNEIIAEYEATHDGVDIEMTRVARDDYANAMFTMFAGGSPPDIVHLAAFEYQPFADEGWLEPLDAWIENSELDLTGWAGQGTCEWDGSTYCIMLLYTGYIMSFNEQMLADAGIDAAPATWDEFLTAARAITKDTDGDGLIDQYGIGLPTKGAGSVMHSMLNFVLDAGGAWTVDGEPTFNSPETIEGISRFKTIFVEKLSPPELGSGDVRQLFIEGRVGMTVDGPWVYNIVKGASDDIRPDLKLAKTPFSPPVGGTSNVLGMPSDLSDDKKQLVWEFIELATSEQFQQRFATLGSSPAPRPGLDYSEEIAKDPYFALFDAANTDAAAAGIDRLPKGLEIEFAEVSKIVLEETQRMLIEDLEPAEAGQRMQDRVLALK
ncbi:sugar ABC transporter substrate-binding protein [Pseudoruegeria sp. SK021]|uniref:ABC transporter substrate-binding protein n=1 Tax=Pseudoruegeria sp. SK021 TaxID=1933035 RepID=UPI000A22D4D5|nr:sugar ABC transporter substrate-binding protein [Pseudoruegeria sp. SK021]OSP55785.1 ABC transporter substrate-binding protein [Pseudoruegeria sp. SK021]